MKICPEYLYSFSNASSTLRVIEHLRNQYQSKLNSVAVINLIDCWLLKIKFQEWITIDVAKNLQAFLTEMGICHQPSLRVTKALAELDAGKSPTKIMNQYHVVIVTYGQPEKEEIEIFREQIVDKLGYCPQNMA